MKLKLYHREFSIISVSLYCLLSPFLVFVGLSLIEGRSSFDLNRLYLFLTENIYFFILSLISFFSIYHLLKLSKWLFLASISLTSFHLLQLFLTSENKFVFLYLCLNLLLGVLFFSIWQSLAKDPIYIPMFKWTRLGHVGLREVDLSVKPSWGEEQKASLTNWSEDSLFIVLESFNQKIEPGKISLFIQFEGVRYTLEGKVISCYRNGLGIRINDENKTDKGYGWSDFYNIIMDRALCLV